MVSDIPARDGKIYKLSDSVSSFLESIGRCIFLEYFYEFFETKTTLVVKVVFVISPESS